MLDERLDELLRMGKAQSGRFFAGLDTAGFGRSVRERVADPSCAREIAKKRAARTWRSFILKTAAAAVCAAVLLLSFGLLFRTHGEKDEAAGSVADQAVAMDGGDYTVSFFRVSMPNDSEPGLFSVLWKQNAGMSETLYSSLFENCDMPFPVTTINFPDTEGKLLLIASGDSGNTYLHYRLVGFIRDDVAPFWAQDYVPDGKLGVRDGILIEQRAYIFEAGKDGPAPSGGSLVSYIVPFEPDEKGRPVMPADSLLMRVGDRLRFVGEGAGSTVEARAEKGAVVLSGPEDNGQTHGIVFTACRAGDDVIALYGKNREETAYLKIRITE